MEINVKVNLSFRKAVLKYFFILSFQFVLKSAVFDHDHERFNHRIWIWK